MREDYSDFKKRKVETVNGSYIGFVNDVVLDLDSQSIIQYKVKSSVLSTKEYLIHRSQIVGFKKNKIIVDDDIELNILQKEKTSKPDPVGTGVVSFRE